MIKYKIIALLVVVFALAGCVKPGEYLGGLLHVDTMDSKGNITSANHNRVRQKEIDLSYLRFDTFLYHNFANVEHSDYVLKSIASAYYPKYR